MNTRFFLVFLLIMSEPGSLLAAGTFSHPSARHTSGFASPRDIPRPLADHPGNVFLEGESVLVNLPDSLPGSVTSWRLLDDTRRLCRSGKLAAQGSDRAPLDLGLLGIGWYRLEFGTAKEPDQAFTTLAVLGRLRAPTPEDSPVCLDSATAWFAQDDAEHQRQLANLATLAGVNWVRDRLRWRDLQPAEGRLVPGPTTYDTAAEIQHRAGLKVLQVFHDTPPWARASPDSGGRFAPDLRHVHQLAQKLAVRFHGKVQAWEPWNEGNVDTFGAHTVDQLCSWQKAAWLGFKAGDPSVIVGWNSTTTVPTMQHTAGLMANETWPYYDTYNIHSYDWSHAYFDLWGPAREATAGRPLWITEADRGTPHMKQPPFYDQDRRLEHLKAEWIAQSYAASLFAGAQRHFHFVLGHYHEPNSVQFGLLRLDLTPRPAYAALAAVGRYLAGAKPLGRWQPAPNLHVHAFRARPDGQERDVLVVWAEKDVDWPERGKTNTDWTPPEKLTPLEVVDYLGRSLGQELPTPVTSSPLFVILPTGQASTLPLESPPTLASPRQGEASPVVLQLVQPRTQIKRVEDLPWSQAYVYEAPPGGSIDLNMFVYNFAGTDAHGSLQIQSAPDGWDIVVADEAWSLASGERHAISGRLSIPEALTVRDGWITLRADCGPLGQPVLAFRVRVAAP